MAITRIAGVPMDFGDGKEYVIPPLSLRQGRALQPRLASYTGKFDADTFDLVVDCVHAALSRNYPAITVEEVSDLLDFGNFARAMDAVMGVSGMKEKGPGEPGAAGSIG